MSTLRTLALLAACLLPLPGADPVRSAWIMGSRPGTAASLDVIRPDVHSVEITPSEAIVRSAGLSLANLGPLASVSRPVEQVRRFEFRLPLKPEVESGKSAHIPPEYGGVFLNGVPVYNHLESASYRGQNLWHYDVIARNDDGTRTSAGRPRPSMTHPSAPGGLIENLIPSRGRHSPIIGFALDGFPIYGPWATDASGQLRRMRSSYRLRAISTRDRWPDGRLLAPGQNGPAIDAEYPLGSFAEDYEYVEGLGDLDRYNGRFAVTPEYPQGTYAYFLSTDDRGRVSFPYLLASEFKGKVRFNSPEIVNQPEAGKLAVLRLDLTERYLEYVHERPVHLLVVSRDLGDFAHIHPELTERGTWEVSHVFPRPGLYRLYIDHTPPGSNQRVDHLDITVPGAAPAARALVPTSPSPFPAIQAGKETELRFPLPSSGLEPYLGAWAHAVVVGEGWKSFIHAHPIEEGISGIRSSEEHSHSPEALGPPPASVRVLTSFPTPGLYKLWLQYQANGKVETIPYVIHVEPGAPATSSAPATIPPGAIRVKITSTGYEPARLNIPPGRPVAIAFERSAEPNCGGKLVFPSLGLTREIPLGAMALVQLSAQEAGRELRFTCGMGMYRGSVVVVATTP